MEAIVPSLITGIVTALGTILGFISTMKQANKKANDELQKSIETKLDAHRHEYLTRIDSVDRLVRDNMDALTDMRAQTQNWQSVMEVKFDNLESKVSKHNQFMERIALLEKDSAVLQNRESVSEHRLTDIERALTHEKEA